MPLPVALLKSRALSAIALTVSGNETADSFGVSRQAGTQGDGIAPGTHGGVGIWPATTNLNDNGNATTNTTGITDNSSTTTRATTGVAKFGTTAFNVVSSNLAANEGPSQAINGGLGSTQYSVSAWVILISGAATVRATLSDSVGGKQGGGAVALNTTTWQRVTVTATTGVAGITEASYIETTVQAVGTWRIGGWQVEASAFAKPYVQTDGADATRAAAKVITAAPPSLEQLSIIIAITLPLASTALPNSAFFDWFEATFANFFSLQWVAVSGGWQLQTVRNGTTTNTTARVDSWAAQATRKLFAGCSPTLIGTAIDAISGGSIVTAARGGTPGGAAIGTTSGIGSRVTTGLQCCSNVLWYAEFDHLLSQGEVSNAFATGTGGVPNLYNIGATKVWDGLNAVLQVRG